MPQLPLERAHFLRRLSVLVVAPTLLLGFGGGCRCAAAPAPASAAAPVADAPKKPFIPTKSCPLPKAEMAAAGEEGAAGAELDVTARVNAAFTAFDKEFDQAHYEEAFACAQEASRLAPDEPAAHLDRGVALDALGEMEEAHQAYERALAIDQDNPETLRAMADFLLRVGNNDGLETALLYARRGREHASEAATGAELAALEAEAANATGRPDEGLRAAETGLALDAEQPDCLVERGVGLFELLRFDEAKKALTQARAKSPNSAKAAHFLGLLCERDEQWDEAKTLLADAARLDPEAYPAALDVTTDGFAKVVDEEIARLTKEQQESLKTTDFSWKDLPDLEDLKAGTPVLSPTIVGLFRPGEFGHKDAILLYRRNLLRIVKTPEELHKEVRDTLLHELGHLAGEDDDELRDRGL